MRLRNKKTGEIVVFGEGIVDLNQMGCKNVAEMIAAGWEDYEEPKKHHYYIEPRGQVIELVFGDDVDELKEELSEIGNYFETKEEAEKTVEKLKAWKRLKDKGLHVTTFYVEDGSLVIRAKAHNSSGAENWEDLNLVFSGEDD